VLFPIKKARNPDRSQIFICTSSGASHIYLDKASTLHIDPEPESHERRTVVLLPELFRPINQHLSKDRKALCAISLVCRILQYEGQRQLYRKMTFSPGTTSSTSVSHIKILKSVLDNNRLALLVHEYGQANLALYGIIYAAVFRRWLIFWTLDDRPTAEILKHRVLVWGKNCNDEDRFLLSQQSTQTCCGLG